MSDSWEDKPIEPVGAPKANPFANLASSAAEWKPNFGASEFVPTFSAPAAAPAPAPAPAPAAAVEKASPKPAASSSASATAAPAKVSKKTEVKDDEGDVVVPTSHLNLNSDERSGLDEDEEVAVADPSAVVPRIKKHVNVVFIGHVDAGKSTISGHILFLNGIVDERTLEKYEREAKAKGRESWKYAWALDTTDEERAKGKTQECGRGTFETETRTFSILDAPGHKHFVPHMIGGASQADIAVLVISARKGEFETGFEKGGQTREHAVLAKTAGVRTLIVAINKMDDTTVNWEKERYDECITKLTPFLKMSGWAVGGDDVIFIPISGLGGINLKDRIPAGVCSFYDGPSLIELLDTIKQPARYFEMPFRMPIHDKYRDMGTIILGKVESGVCRKKQLMTIMPNSVPVRVEEIFIDTQEVDVAEPGDNVRMKVKGIEEEDLRYGFVMCQKDSVVQGCRYFDAKVNILEYKSIICPGYISVMHIHAATEEVAIMHLLATLDKKGQVLEKKPKFVKQGQSCLIRFKAAQSVCVETFKDFPQLGRFMLRDEGKTIAVGIITALHFPKAGGAPSGDATAEGGGAAGAHD